MLEVRAFLLAEGAVPLEGAPLIFKAEQGLERASPEGMGQHGGAVSQYEEWVVREGSYHTLLKQECTRIANQNYQDFSIDREGGVAHLSFCCVALLTASVSVSRAQIVIEERVEVTPSQPEATVAYNDAALLTASGSFVAPDSGLVKVYYRKAEAYGNALDANVKLRVTVRSASDSTQSEQAVADHFLSPLRVQSGDCPSNWHLYGEGPFSYVAPSGPGRSRMGGASA